MRGISLWLPSKVGGASHSEGASNDVVSTEGSPLPPYFSRINTAKLLMEVQEFDVSWLATWRNYNTCTCCVVYDVCPKIFF